MKKRRFIIGNDLNEDYELRMTKEHREQRDAEHFDEEEWNEHRAKDLIEAGWVFVLFLGCFTWYIVVRFVLNDLGVYPFKSVEVMIVVWTLGIFFCCYMVKALFYFLIKKWLSR